MRENIQATDKLPITEKNRFLVEGNLDDVEILYNASPIAPHAAQNLRGDIVFAQNEAIICLFGQNPDGLALTVKQAISAKADPRQIAVLVEPCNPEHLLGYDIVATQRDAFLRSKRDDALALIKTIEEDNYRKFAEVTAAELKKAADVERAQIREEQRQYRGRSARGLWDRAPKDRIGKPLPRGRRQGSEPSPIATARRGQAQPRNADTGRHQGHKHR